MKTAGFSYLFVCSICHEVLFWLKYMGKIWLQRAMQLEKERVFQKSSQAIVGSFFWFVFFLILHQTQQVVVTGRLVATWNLKVYQ